MNKNFLPQKKDNTNRKIRNASKVQFNDIKFDSELELYMYKLLLRAKISLVFKPKFILVPSFHYEGELVREISWRPDYIVSDYNMLIDPKGYANDNFPLKLKLFKKWCIDNDKHYEFYFPKNKKECDSIYFLILSKKNKAIFQ